MPHWVGQSGRLKSSVAAAMMAHFGELRTKDDLPARWEVTEYILEKGCFLAKDVPLVIDDLNPEHTRIRKDDLERRFSRIAGNVGNLTGRRRMGAPRPSTSCSGSSWFATASRLPRPRCST